MHWALILGLLVGCGGEPDRAAPTPETPARTADDELVDRWFVAMERQLEADAKLLADSTFAGRDEANRALEALTPGGFRPKPEYFQALYGATPPEEMGKRLADYAAARPADMQRRADAMMKRLEPAMMRAFENVQRQVRDQ